MRWSRRERCRERRRTLFLCGVVAACLAVGLIGSLTGCAHDEPASRLQSLCLPMKVYSTEAQKSAASELAALPDSSVLAQMMVDYGAMRAANRACQGQPIPMHTGPK